MSTSPPSSSARPDGDPVAHTPPAPLPTPPTPPTRAGRNLPAALGVGVGLGALVVASLFIRKEGFLVLATAAICVAVWELRSALAQGRIHVPLVPALAGALAMMTAAYVGGGEALTVSFGLTCVGGAAVAGGRRAAGRPA